MNNDKEKLAIAITKALGYAENGGKPDLKNPKAGKTGEAKSIFQFTPDTWKAYSKEVLGKDNVPITADTESFVVHKKVSDWLNKGYNPKQIASMWNAGIGEPDAYSGKFSNGQPSKGVNAKYGIAFDVPTYAEKVNKYTEEFVNETTPQTIEQPKNQQPNQQGGSDPLVNHLLDLVKSAPGQGNIASAKGNPGLIGQAA